MSKRSDFVREYKRLEELFEKLEQDALANFRALLRQLRLELFHEVRATDRISPHRLVELTNRIHDLIAQFNGIANGRLAPSFAQAEVLGNESFRSTYVQCRHSLWLRYCDIYQKRSANGSYG